MLFNWLKKHIHTSTYEHIHCFCWWKNVWHAVETAKRTKQKEGHIALRIICINRLDETSETSKLNNICTAYTLCYPLDHNTSRKRREKKKTVVVFIVCVCICGIIFSAIHYCFFLRTENLGQFSIWLDVSLPLRLPLLRLQVQQFYCYYSPTLTYLYKQTKKIANFLSHASECYLPWMKFVLKFYKRNLCAFQHIHSGEHHLYLGNT